jgi:seryl-tRNA synthetase
MRRQLNEMKTLSKEHAKSGKSLEQLSKDQKKHNQDIVKFQEELASIEEKLMIEALKIPNQTHPDAPVGDESKATCLRVVGKKREFDFEPLDHLEIGKKFDLFDFDNAAKITDSKFVLLKNEAALLEQALINYGVDKIIKKGFTFMTTPDICKNTIIEGCGFNPRDDSSASNIFIYLFFN